MGKVAKDPFKVVMRKSHLPVTLLQEKAKYVRPHILETETFASTFGPKATRKRPNIKFNDMDDLLKQTETKTESYSEEKDKGGCHD
jgi:nuclear GTP-binding protein